MTTYHAGDYTPPSHFDIYPQKGDPSGPLEVRFTRGGETVITVDETRAADLMLLLAKVLHRALD